MSMSTLKFQNHDVIKIMLQFCQENSLPQTLETLQTESQVSLSTVDNIKTLVADINSGKWEAVLRQIKPLKLSSIIWYLQEHIALEMIELGDEEYARAIFKLLDEGFVSKHLEDICNGTPFDPNKAYRGSTKEVRRALIAQAIATEVTLIPPSRLMTIIRQSVEWHNRKEQILSGYQFDLLRGKPVKAEDYPRKLSRTIKFGTNGRAKCVCFSPDGQFLVSCSVDNLVKVWDYKSGELKHEPCEMTDDAFLCVAFRRDSEMFASGSRKGDIIVWRIGTGQPLKFLHLEYAHSDGVTSLSFSRNGMQLLSTSSDKTARIYSLESGNELNTFLGHRSVVNGATFTKNEKHVITASSDHNVMVWDVKTANCIYIWHSSGAVNSVFISPKNTDHIVVCDESSEICIITLNCQVVKRISSERLCGDFVAACVSPKGEWIYTVGKDRNMYCFSYQSGELEHLMNVEEMIGVTHHPCSNLVATYSEDGTMKLWEP